MTQFYQLNAEKALKKLNSSHSGLTDAMVLSLLQEYGKNELIETRQKSKFSILLSQFEDIMIIILIIAAIISFFVGDQTDALVIVAIIILNAWLGFSQEYNAEESMRMLKKMSAQHALVVRNGHPIKIEANQLVPGDLILLSAGDIVPADARLLEVNSFKTDEASLTGESFSIEKIAQAIHTPKLVPGDQHNMIFKSTVVSNGASKAVVTATGMNTEIGKIAGLLKTGPQKTPLQKRLSRFSVQLAVIVITVCAGVLGFGLWRGEPPVLMFLTALSLAVAALPEALPAVITIALAQGAKRMVKQKALVRKLPAVETLGSVTYICSDKTGTLTQNIMTVEKTKSTDGNEELLIFAMLLNNDVRFSKEKELLGDSTETAMVKYALDHGLTKENAEITYPLAAKLPFDAERMRMSTLHAYQDQWILFVKGAPVKIAEVLSEDFKESVKAWLEINREWASDGMRVLFFAYKIFDKKPQELKAELETDLEFLGLVAMIDPPREEVIDAIHQCQTAGIKTIMITGDQPLTAKNIAERLHILENDNKEVITGADLENFSDEDYNRKVKNISVYARVSPEQKLKIVKALQTNGEFVAMTGDGVNDAPSLKQADIGLAMGITGTDVAKEAADMILLDDNFATIVKAIKEGRRIYANIRKFIVYVLSCNLSEILTIFLAPILGFAIPLLPIHILWINLVTDGLPGIALVAEPAEKDIMNRPPSSSKVGLFAGGLIPRILFTGVIMTIAVLFAQWWAIRQGFDIKTQQTMVFTTLCFVQLGNALSVRSDFHWMFHSGIFSNRRMWGAIALILTLQLMIVYLPFLHPFFKTTNLPIEAMMVILAVTFITVICIEVLKYVSKKKYLS